ncbi:MAG: hypothetical protein Q8Q59_11120 [Luteolibacter sp.]|jgi:hypothetical protein|nr:hypothetical protein [Luteolibacter sp.]
MKQTSDISPSQMLAKTLADEIPEIRIVQVLSHAMTAEVVNRDGSRSPDHRTRLSAAETALAYRHGLPVRREETVTVAVDADSAFGMKERLAHSPALRAMFRKMLDEVENASAIEA